MSLTELRVENVRCIESAELSLHPGCNLICGGNGAGKTSLLEAVFLLGRGRSFRTRHSGPVIRHGSERMTVFGRSETGLHAMGVEIDRYGGTQARVNGRQLGSLAELTLIFPVQVIDPEIHKLVEEGSRRRRRWLDWMVFHVEPRFGDWWVRYARALRQRNAALKSRAADTRPWEFELTDAGENIAEARRAAMGAFQTHWQQVIAALGCPAADLQYVRGWTSQCSLQEALHASRTRDQLRQLTHQGPHRADVVIQVSGKPAREVLSRGQQKLIAAALILAQLRFLRDGSGPIPTLLLDDPAAELDAEHLVAFVDEVSRLHCQMIATSLHREIAGFQALDRVFHVEQGRVHTV